MEQAEFRDPRLVAVYDRQCPWSHEDDFFQLIVDRTPRSRVLDLGCGTGRLALELAAGGHLVTGVDPAHASLAAARSKPLGSAVTWIHGDSSVLPTAAFDVALMTSHVAQFLVSDATWAATLSDLRQCLVPGGLLAFDSRDPADRAWDRWNAVESRHTVTVEGEAVEVWTEVDGVADEVVRFTHHYTWPGGLVLESTAALRFRPLDDISEALKQAGFVLEQVFGGWAGQSVGAGDGELLVLARRY